MPPVGVDPPEGPPRPRPRELAPREVVLRLRVPPRAGLAAVLDVDFARGVEALRVAVEREDPEVDDFARDAVDFLAPLLRDAVDFGRDVDALRAPPVLRAPLLLRDEDDEPELAPALPSIDHLPDITRCAASATASAISEPNLVALATMLLAACDAVSAASRPASRIARRALGLALIAAAAAAKPAASISLLIAALASLSTVSLLEEDLLEELPLEDLAIASSPVVLAKDTSSP